MKAEALEEADSRRKYQRTDKSKRQGMIVELPFAFIVGPKKAPQEQDCCRSSRDSQNEEGCVERQNPTDKTDSNDGEKRREIEEYERGSTPVG
jgi:hypothetical protein